MKAEGPILLLLWRIQLIWMSVVTLQMKQLLSLIAELFPLKGTSSIQVLLQMEQEQLLSMVQPILLLMIQMELSFTI